MSGSFVLFSRLCVVIGAAVVLIMSLHTVVASPAVPIAQNRVKYNAVRRLNTDQQVPSAGLSEKLIQTPMDSLSIRNNQSQPVPFTQGRFRYSHNSLDKTRPQVKITKLQSGGMRPATRIQTYEGQSLERSRIPDNTLLHKEGNTGNLYTNFFQYPKMSVGKGEFPTGYYSKVDEDKSARRLHSVHPSQTGGLQSAQLLSPRRHAGNFLETSQLPNVWTGTNKMPERKAVDFTSQNRGGAESLGNRLNVIIRKPSLEKSSSISTFPQNQNIISREEMLENNNIQSNLFKDFPAQVYTVTSIGQDDFRLQSGAVSWDQKKSPSGSQEKSKFMSKFNHFSRTDPNKQESETQIGLSRPRITVYPAPHKAVTPTPSFLPSVAAEDKNWPNLVSAVHSNFQNSRKTFAPLDRLNATSRELRQAYKPRQSVKRLHPLNGLANSGRKSAKKLSLTDRTQSILDKRKDLGFRFSNPYHSSSQKYSFGQQRASATTTTPGKPDRVESFLPSPIAHGSWTSTAQPITLKLKSPQPETEASIKRNKNSDSYLRLYKGRFGLKGYTSQPLEGANALPQSTDAVIVPKPSFKGFVLRNSEVFTPKRIRIHRWNNRRGEIESGGSTDTETPGFASNQITSEAQTLQGAQLSENRTVDIRSLISLKPAEQNTVWHSQIASSSYLTSAEKVTDNVSPPHKAADRRNPVTDERVGFKTLTSSTVRGKRVKVTQAGSRKLFGPINGRFGGNSVIRRLPKVKAVTYADILGSASFSSVRALGHSRSHFPNITMEQEEGWEPKSDDVRNMSRTPEANFTSEIRGEGTAETEEEADNEVEASDLFFESEGSGGFDLSDVLPSASDNEPAGNNMLELDYLRKSTGNVSFKSVSKLQQERR